MREEYRLVGSVMRDYFALMPDRRYGIEQMLSRNAASGAGRSLAAPFVLQARPQGGSPKSWKDCEVTQEELDEIRREEVARMAAVSRR